MEQVTLFYRTRDGKEDYRFCFERQQNGEWRIYILSQPSYGKALQSLHVTHRQYDQKGKFVSWDGPIKTLEEAKQIAALWAEHTQDYIKAASNKKGRSHEKSEREKADRKIYSLSQDDDDSAFEYY